MFYLGEFTDWLIMHWRKQTIVFRHVQDSDVH